MLWPDRSWNVFAVGGALVGTLAITVVAGLVYLAALALYGNVSHHPLNPSRIPAFQLLLAQLVSYVPIALFLLFVLPRISRVSLADLGVRKPAFRDIGIGLAGAVVMWLVVVLTGSAIAEITHRHDTQTAIALLHDLHGSLQIATFALVACVCAPIVEELTFRTLVFNAMSKYMSVAAAAICSGLLFGGEHALGSPLSQLLTVALPLTCGGIVLAYVYATSRNFWSSVTTHASFNAVGVVALVVFHVSA